MYTRIHFVLRSEHAHAPSSPRLSRKGSRIDANEHSRIQVELTPGEGYARENVTIRDVTCVCVCVGRDCEYGKFIEISASCTVPPVVTFYA